MTPRLRGLDSLYPAPVPQVPGCVREIKSREKSGSPDIAAVGLALDVGLFFTLLVGTLARRLLVVALDVGRAGADAPGVLLIAGIDLLAILAAAAIPALRLAIVLVDVRILLGVWHGDPRLCERRTSAYIGRGHRAGQRPAAL